MESQGVKIDIELTDDCRNLRAGMHTVSYIAFSDGTLWCIDKDGETYALQCPEFRFAKVSWFDTRADDSGRVSVKLGEIWIDLGPMFVGYCGDGRVPARSREAQKEAVGAFMLPEWPGLGEAM